MADADGSPWRSGTTWMTVTGRTVATPVAQAGQHGAPQRTPVEVGGALMCSEHTRWAKYRAPGGQTPTFAAGAVPDSEVGVLALGRLLDPIDLKPGEIGVGLAFPKALARHTNQGPSEAHKDLGVPSGEGIGLIRARRDL